jgi:hypothetical protein
MISHLKTQEQCVHVSTSASYADPRRLSIWYSHSIHLVLVLQEGNFLIQTIQKQNQGVKICEGFVLLLRQKSYNGKALPGSKVGKIYLMH